ncbi:hypothetical protein BH10PSE15_BH10PSE15_09510 [soil metagenome]
MRKTMMLAVAALGVSSAALAQAPAQTSPNGYPAPGAPASDSVLAQPPSPSNTMPGTTTSTISPTPSATPSARPSTAVAPVGRVPTAGPRRATHN